jgi:hypothetical protein
MLLWISLLAGLALIISAGVLVLLMRNAERNARRALYRALSIDDQTIDGLLKQGGDAASHLASIRGTPGMAAEPADGDTPQTRAASGPGA